eukprot:scaffold31_cov263-Pinguiococcus_pyrenoidosus.AAC.61
MSSSSSSSAFWKIFEFMYACLCSCVFTAAGTSGTAIAMKYLVISRKCSRKMKTRNLVDGVAPKV